MTRIFLVLACLACTGCGRRMQNSVEQLAAFNPSAGPRTSPTRSQMTNGASMPTALNTDSRMGSLASPAADSVHSLDHASPVSVTIRPPAQSMEVTSESAQPREMQNMAGMAATAAAAAAATMATADAAHAQAEVAAAATSLTFLAQLQQICAKASFASLMASTGIYWGKAAGFGGGVTGKDHGAIPNAVMGVSSALLASLLSARWIESGHFPLSNMYESLMFLGWGVTAVHFWIVKSIPKSAIAGALTSPLALSVTAGATLLLPKDLQKAESLVPALQSNWLMMHVSVMMMSYAALLAGSLFAGAFLIAAAPSDNIVGKARNRLGSLFGGSKPHEAEAVSTEATAASTEATVTEASVSDANAVAASSQQETTQADPWSQIQSGNTVQVLEAKSTEEFSMSNFCNDLAYQCSFLGFLLLTTGLISGAVWANDAWGSYWSWDPKETWALITWLVYAAYLHTRLSPQYTDNFRNGVCLGGFMVTTICYIGVNIFSVGLHSYGWLANK